MRAALIWIAAGLLLLVMVRGDVYVNGMVALLLLCLLAPLWHRWQAGRLDLFESVHVVGSVYFVFFGLGALWILGDPVNVAYDRYVPPFVPQAVLCCLLGYIALLAGYFGPWFRGPARSSGEELPRGVLFLLVTGGVGLAGSLVEAALVRSFWLGQTFSGVTSSLAQLSPLWIFAWAMFWMLFLSGRLEKGRRRLFALLFVSGTALIAASSMTDKSLLVSLAGVPLISLWYARRRIAWRSLLILLLVLVFVVFPFHNTFRMLDARIPWESRVSMTVGVIGGWDLEEYRRHSLVTFQSRLALANSVAIVIRDVPRWVPYEQGATLFLPLLYLSVPRAVWPAKPQFSMGRRFAETFRAVHILDEQTRVSVTVPGELYWNFDLPGVIVGMALWGLALRFFYRRYGETAGLDPVRRAIHIVLLIQFAHFGGGLAGQSVGLLRTLILLEALRWIGRRAGWLEAVTGGGMAGRGE